MEAEFLVSPAATSNERIHSGKADEHCTNDQQGLGNSAQRERELKGVPDSDPSKEQERIEGDARDREKDSYEKGPFAEPSEK